MFFMGTYTPNSMRTAVLRRSSGPVDGGARGDSRAGVLSDGLGPWTTSWSSPAKAEAPVTVKGAQDYTRFLFAGASEEKPDKQGGSITPMLREYASLDRDVVVIGVMNRIEIWDPAAVAVAPRSRRRILPSARGLPRSDPRRTTAPRQHRTARHHQRNRRTRSRARSQLCFVIWGSFPAAEDGTSPRGDRDLVRRIRT